MRLPSGAHAFWPAVSRSRIDIDQTLRRFISLVHCARQIRRLVPWNSTLLLHSSNAIHRVNLLPEKPIMAQCNKWLTGGQNERI
jgi:hypothetical protein